jgi:deoxycytidylate deaminase
MPEAKAKLKSVPGAVAASDGQSQDLESRNTDELVVGLVGPVGSGVTMTGTVLMNEFRERYGYTITPIRVSDLITERAHQIGVTIPTDEAERRSVLQKVGSEGRKQFSAAYWAEKCVEKIAVYRKQEGGYAEGTLVPIRMRHVHVIDSLKNPAEVELFRKVYGDNFWLVGVFAPENVRKQRLHDLNQGKLQQVMDTDEEEGVDYGQRVADTMHLADFFVRNDGQNDVGLRTAIGRYLAILFNVGLETPTQDEKAMLGAMSAAAGSACMSRQVGAVIYTKAGELIGTGGNDVPKNGGGLYSSEDGANDHRCYKWAGKICHNDARKRKLYSAIFNELRSENIIDGSTGLDKVEKALASTDLRNLIEYSRSVHAEMEAIVSVARGGKSGIVGAMMYVTTFPCHSCARHIVASGIERVIFIEPYSKSLALELHSDAVSQVDDNSGRVLFLQYEGVAPKNVVRLFKNGIERKSAAGKLVQIPPTEARPVFPSPLDGFTRREQIVVKKIKELEEGGEKSEEPSKGKKESGTAQLDLAAPKPS